MLDMVTAIALIVVFLLAVLTLRHMSHRNGPAIHDRPRSADGRSFPTRE